MGKIKTLSDGVVVNIAPSDVGRFWLLPVPPSHRDWMRLAWLILLHIVPVQELGNFASYTVSDGVVTFWRDRRGAHAIRMGTAQEFANAMRADGFRHNAELYFAKLGATPALIEQMFGQAQIEMEVTRGIQRSPTSRARR